MPNHETVACRTTQHCAFHGWCRRCDPAFAAVMSRVNVAIQRTDADDTHWGPLYAAVAEALRPAAVSVPPPAPRADDQAALRDRIRRAVCEAEGFGWDTDMLEPDEYGEVADAVLAVLPEPTDRAAALREAADAVFALDYDVMVGEEGDENLGSMREAWDLGTIHAEKLLRRLADESAVVPPPALTEEGRLRAQVEVLQQDAERDQGLAKVGARCMRDGHQGLIEQGRLVLEGWRFALSTALDLGTGAPWEAIHERVKELTAAVSGPCVAGEQQNETPEAEVVHGCPPDGSGLTPCCGRTPFELPLTDRISSEAPVTCPGKEA